MALTKISSIIVPPQRQRREMGDISSLANSLKKIGLINPIVITPDEIELGMFLLVAGERRLRAAKTLSWPEIETSLLSELDTATRALVELEENIRRKQLTWQEECQAILKYFNLAKKPATAVSGDLCVSQNWLDISLVVARNLDRYPQILSASALRPAYSMLQTLQERENENLMESLESEIKQEGAKTPTFQQGIEIATRRIDETSSPAPTQSYPIQAYTTGQLLEVLPEEKSAPAPAVFNQPFQEWLEDYTGPRFNLVHCDFPYGLNMGTQPLQNSRPSLDLEGERYDDSPELFLELLSTLVGQQKKIFANSCHLIFWTAFKNYSMAVETFEDIGFRVCETPLIWHKTDNRGIAPDVRRWPRRTYEVALFASKGDRKLLNLKAASIALPTANDLHLSAKPYFVLKHFFSMLVDKSTEMLDPTCGSGTALEAAASLGAGRVVGVEKEKRYATMSEKAYQRGLKTCEELAP